MRCYVCDCVLDWSVGHETVVCLTVCVTVVSVIVCSAIVCWWTQDCGGYDRVGVSSVCVIMFAPVVCWTRDCCVHDCVRDVARDCVLV